MKLGCGLFGLGYALDRDFLGNYEKLADTGFTAVEPLLAFADDPALSPESKKYIIAICSRMIIFVTT